MLLPVEHGQADKAVPKSYPLAEALSLLNESKRSPQPYVLNNFDEDETAAATAAAKASLFLRCSTSKYDAPLLLQSIWQIERTSSRLDGSVLKWHDVITLRHMATGKYLAIDEQSYANSEKDHRAAITKYRPVLLDNRHDPRAAFCFQVCHIQKLSRETERLSS